MKRIFLTGVATMLPMAITLFVVIWLVDMLTAPFSGFLTLVFSYYGVVEYPILLNIISKLLVLIFLFLSLLALGYLANTITLSYFLHWGDRLIEHIPIINGIYRSLKHAVYSLNRKKEPTFSQVVLVPFPDACSYTIGLITSQHQMILQNKESRISISVFVPSCPNPTGGLVLTFEPSKIQFLNFKVDEAMKFIVSFGTIKPELLTIGASTF